MRSKVIDGSNFENRTLIRIQELKRKIDDNTEFKAKDLSVGSPIHKCFKVLEGTNVICKSGSRKFPKYCWNNKVVINTKLANKVASIIRENDRKKYPSSKASMSSIDEVDSTPIPENMQLCFSMYSDQQIWDELKNRGYSIKEDKLFKCSYLK